MQIQLQIQRQKQWYDTLSKTNTGQKLIFFSSSKYHFILQFDQNDKRNCVSMHVCLHVYQIKCKTTHHLHHIGMGNVRLNDIQWYSYRIIPTATN